jgi:hypothetical protein
MNPGPAVNIEAELLVIGYGCTMHGMMASARCRCTSSSSRRMAPCSTNWRADKFWLVGLAGGGTVVGPFPRPFLKTNPA